MVFGDVVEMIIVIVGYVDYGKIILLQVIIGVNVDCLLEEKKCGMIIDFGYVYWLQLDGCVFGFIDVFGYEKFFFNMLVGVGGIDYVLLVVVCDDGVMVQICEYLVILQLIGNLMLIVVLIKVDCVDEVCVDEVECQVKEVLWEYGFAEAKLFIIVVIEGWGIDVLCEYLFQLLECEYVS